MGDDMVSEGSRRSALPWRTLLAEFVIIVVGVAVGLAVDSAREARAESRRAAEYLEQMRAELAVASERTEEQIGRSRSISGAAERLLEGLNQPTLPPEDSLRGWWISLFSLGSYRPNTATIDALVEGGDLRLIRDPELRRAIMAYREHAETTQTASAIADEIAAQAIARIGESMSLANISFESAGTRIPLDWEAASDDPAFHSQVQIIRVGASSIVQLLIVLQEASEGLASLIGTALR